VQSLIGFAAFSVISSMGKSQFAQPSCATISVRAHSPPLLATTCIRLI
jgi:hypothetical protein